MRERYVLLLSDSVPVSLAKERIRLYEEAGADSIFVPGITDFNDIKDLTEFCSLPINVMCGINLPDFSTLKSLGVKRISMGNFIFENMNKYLENSLSKVQKEQSFEGFFNINSVVMLY